MSQRSIIGIRARRSGGVLFAPAVLLLGLRLVEQLRTTEIPVWTDVGHALAYSVVLLGPVVASATAFHVAREGRQPLRELLEAMPRRAYHGDLALVAGPLFWVLAAYFALVVWLVAVTAFGARSGFPDLELILAGLTAIVALTSLGFLAGRLAPSYLTPPVVAVAVYLLVAITGVGDTPFAPLSPVIDGEPNPLTPFPSEMGLLQSLWFGSLAVALFTIGTVWRETARVLVVTAVVANILAVAAAIALMRMEPWFQNSVGVRYEAVCQTKSRLEVCLHPAFADVLRPAAGAASLTLLPLREATGWPSRVLQVGLASDTRTLQNTQPDTLGFAWAPADGGAVSDGVTQTVAFAAVGAETCQTHDGLDPVREGLAFWLIEQASQDDSPFPDSPLVKRIDALGETELSKWLRTNLEALRSCREVPPPARR